MGNAYEALKKTGFETGSHLSKVQSEFHKISFSFDISTDKRHLFLTNLDALKTNFLTRYAKQDVKTILFSGVSKGCGTSTLAAFFAANLAKDSKLKVLLIDANFRRPSLHHIFRISQNSGMLDLLKLEDPTGFKIRRIGSDYLYFLPSGGVSPDPVRLLGSSQFDGFINKVRKSLDFIVIDSPSPSTYPESKIICSKLDGVIIVADAEISRRQVAMRMKKDFQEAGGRVLGVILNKRSYYIPKWLYDKI